MTGILIKATGIWLVILIGAIVNGLLREKLLVDIVGEKYALPLSGVLLSVLILVVSILLIPVLNSSDKKTFIITGVFWLTLTLAFEFLFGHFVVGKSWHEIFYSFNPWNGDLFILVVVVTAIAPWVSAKVKGIL